MWRNAQNVGQATTVASWRATVHTDAAALAEAWRRYCQASTHPRQRPRLALMADWRARADLFDFDTLSAWLARPETGLQALVTADGYASLARPRWHWPLQVGVPTGAEGAAVLATLRQAQGRRSWVADLSRCFTVGDAREACDLLILTPSAVTQILGQARTRVRASFIVCLEDSPPDLARLASAYVALRERLMAAGVAAINQTDKSFQLADWFVAVLQEVSHDLPIHAAVWGTGRWRFNLDQFLVGDPAALDTCRLLAIAQRQDRVVEALEGTTGGDQLAQPAATLGIDLDAMPSFGGPAGGADAIIPSTPVPAPTGVPIAHRNLANELRNRAFVAESVDGVQTVRELANQKDEIDGARVPRWIQASAWRPDAPELAAGSLAPQQWNLLGVYIAPSAVQRIDEPFPPQAIDFSSGDVVVSVQAELSGANVTALDAADLKWMFNGDLRPSDLRDGGERSGKLLRGPLAKLPIDSGGTSSATTVGLAAATLVLPPAGESTVAVFAVLPVHDKKIDGRIAIIHKNRVLQTARLSVGVGIAAAGGAGVEVITEAADPPARR